MTKEEAGKLSLGDTVFVYDPGVKLVYSASVIGIACPDLGKPKKPPELSVDITACSQEMSTRVYKPHEVHTNEKGALTAKAAKIQFEIDRLLNEKSRVTHKILALSKK